MSLPSVPWPSLSACFHPTTRHITVRFPAHVCILPSSNARSFRPHNPRACRGMLALRTCSVASH